MAHRETMIQRERRMQERAAQQSYNASHQTSSYSSNINRESSASAQYSNEDSRNYARDERRYQGDNGYEPRRVDEFGREPITTDPEELSWSPPQDRATPPSNPPQSQAAPPSQPTYQTKPRSTWTPSKGNVRIVGGKLFHVGDDVEGPVSIQFIPDHPDPGPRGYSVAQSTSLPVGKPRYATDASGHRFHYIA